MSDNKNVYPLADLRGMRTTITPGGWFHNWRGPMDGAPGDLWHNLGLGGPLTRAEDWDLAARAPELLDTAIFYAEQADNAERTIAELRADIDNMWNEINAVIFDEPCPKCGDGPDTTRRWLYDGDRVPCVCGHEGRVIASPDNLPMFEWDEVTNG